MMGPGNIDLSIDKNHILTDALSDDNFVYEYIIDDLNDSELFDEMYEKTRPQISVRTDDSYGKHTCVDGPEPH